MGGGNRVVAVAEIELWQLGWAFLSGRGVDLFSGAFRGRGSTERRCWRFFLRGAFGRPTLLASIAARPLHSPRFSLPSPSLTPFHR